MNEQVEGLQEAPTQQEPSQRLQELLWYRQWHRRLLALAGIIITVVGFLSVTTMTRAMGPTEPMKLSPEKLSESSVGSMMAGDPLRLVKHPQWLERCWEQTHLREDPGQYSETVGPPFRMSNGSAIHFDKEVIPYIFVVPKMHDGTCPSWFEANLKNTLEVQRTRARLTAFRPQKLHPVVLLEGSSPSCQVDLTWYLID